MSLSVKKVILPAAGLGTRFLPVTKASPKEMLPLVDKPLIQYAVEEARHCGIDEFIVITGKNKRAIEDHFDMAPSLEDALRNSGKADMMDGIRWLEDIKLAYIRQGVAKGLGHAVYCAKPFVDDEAVAVILSDDIVVPAGALLSEMIELFKEVQSPIVALERVPRSEISRYGVISGEAIREGVFRIDDMVEKPSAEEAPSDLAIIGRYILTPDIFGILEGLPPGAGGEIQLTDALKLLIAERPVYGYVLRGRRYDAGSKLGFLKATVDLALENPLLADEFGSYIVETSSRVNGH
jgi:UTP--glucose-1-phosphate uridylyltransferase